MDVAPTVCLYSADNMVYYIFALFVFAAPQVLAEDDSGIMSCLELFKPENMQRECCESMAFLKEDFESCKTKDGEDWECSNAKCVLDKASLLNGDQVDDKKVVEAIDKAAQDHPSEKAMFDRVKNECLKGNFEHYPPKEACPLLKFLSCTYVNSIVECSAWKPDAACKELSDHAKKCKSVLDSMKE